MSFKVHIDEAKLGLPIQQIFRIPHCSGPQKSSSCAAPPFGISGCGLPGSQDVFLGPVLLLRDNLKLSSFPGTRQVLDACHDLDFARR